MATFIRLKSGSWRVQVRRKGKYVNNTFLRRKDAEEWALETERRIDRGEPSIACREARTFGDLIRLHRADLQEVGKRIGRSKTASLTFLERRLGRLRLSELDRERLIQFGKERAREGAGPVTLGIDLGYIKTILCHAAAVHGMAMSETGDQHRMSSTASSRHSIRIHGNRFRLAASSVSRSRQPCGRMKSVAWSGQISIATTRCSSYGIVRIREGRMETISAFLYWMSVDMTLGQLLRNNEILRGVMLDAYSRIMGGRSGRPSVGNVDS